MSDEKFLEWVKKENSLFKDYEKCAHENMCTDDVEVHYCSKCMCYSTEIFTFKKLEQCWNACKAAYGVGKENGDEDQNN